MDRPMAPRRRPALLVLIMTHLAAAAAAAQGIVAPPRCGPAMDCVRVTPVPIRSQVVRTGTRVSALLRRQVVQVEVTETFVNRGAGLGEADYLFPLPGGAAFEDLRLSINGELVAGEVLNAQQARAVYEEIVRRQRDPALVEWMGRGLVRTRIFPIAPGEEKRVVLRYTQPLAREGDAVRLDWQVSRTPGEASAPAPTTWRLRWDDGAGFGRPYSPTHTLAERGAREVEATLGGSDLTTLVPVREGREAAIALVSHAPSGDERWAMLTFSPPAITARRQARDVTFVLDVSGSMSGRKLEQAKAAGRQLLGTLSAGDRLRLVAFASDVREWREGFVPATSANLRDAAAWLDGLQATGGTNIASALDAALATPTAEGAVPLVLFVTDGAPTVGVTDPEQIAAGARTRRGAARVFTFGLGADVNAALVERLALEGRGTAQFVRPAESVERAVGVTASRLTAPLVTDLRVRGEGVRLVRQHPEGPQDVFAGQDLVLFAQVEGSGEATVVLSGRTADGPVEWRERVNIPVRESGNAFVGKLWATQRVGWLSAARRSGGSAEIDTELRQLGERWGIPTELTSYLVLEPGVSPGMPSPSPMPMAAPARGASDLAFETARRASAMRSVTTEQAAEISTGAMADVAIRTDASRRVGGRRFVRRDSMWVDVTVAARDPRRTVTVQPYSAAWFALAQAVPELSKVFALGDRVQVAGRRVIVVVDRTGAATLSPDAVRGIVDAW